MGRVRQSWGGIWGYGQGQAVMGRHVGLWEGSGSGGEAYGAIRRVRQWWGGMWGYGQGQTVVGRHTEPWAGSGSGGEACGAMGRVRQWWGGIWGYGQGQAVVGRHMGHMYAKNSINLSTANLHIAIYTTKISI